MTGTYKLTVEKNGLKITLNNFFRKFLSEKVVDSLLIPQDSPTHNTVLQTLVKSEEEVKNVNLFAPILLMNSAKLISQLTADKPDEKIGVVMRPCEIRATIELVKLKQVHLDNLIIIGTDCLGTYESRVYQEIARNFTDLEALTDTYLAKTIEGKVNLLEDKELRLACQGCEYPNPENTDISINFLGYDIHKEILIQVSEKSRIELQTFGLVPVNDISVWKKSSQICRDERIKSKERIFQEVQNQTKDIRSFLKELEHCRRCYNCRKECPICYCRECIFDSLTFEHAGEKYFEWAQKKGRIRMPTDTLLFHLTRMNHMVISCVACGQCTSACPNGIQVAKFFKAIGFKVQSIFNYKPGINIEEEIPQAVFKEDEFQDVGK